MTAFVNSFAKSPSLAYALDRISQEQDDIEFNSPGGPCDQMIASSCYELITHLDKNDLRPGAHE